MVGNVLIVDKLGDVFVVHGILRNIKDGVMQVIKPKRYVSEAYKVFIREQPCLICGRRAEPHHQVSRGAGGSDLDCLPFCRKHHTQVEQMGKTKFHAAYTEEEEILRDQVRLLQKYIEKLEHENLSQIQSKKE